MLTKTSQKFGKGLIRQTIMSFPNGSSGGSDGLVPQHLKDLTAIGLGKTADTLLASLSSFLDLVARGCVPPEVRPTFFGARLVALQKPDETVRPIAIGMTLRRLTSKLVNANIEADAADRLKPYQVGYSTKGGAEAAVHSLRRFVNGSTGNDVVLKVDLFQCLQLHQQGAYAEGYRS